LHILTERLLKQNIIYRTRVKYPEDQSHPLNFINFFSLAPQY